jgi:hypothetical protein
MNLAADLRRDLANRAQKYSHREGLPHSLSYGQDPVVCFPAYEEDARHGNFLRSSYKAICRNPAWHKRLTKVHSQARRSLPRSDRRWMELDSCMSSDALLMNIFCNPGVFRDGAASSLLGSDPDADPTFGYKARVPLVGGRCDRTEVDMRLGDLLVEAKLTESDFQSTEKRALLAYRDFALAFDPDQLPQTETRYISYQLLRNVLTAYAQQCSFCVLVDARRPDLIGKWYAAEARQAG